MQDVLELVQHERTGGMGVFARSLYLEFEKQPELALSYDLEGTKVSKILTL